ncbi:hypothetical protein LG275_07975 [Chryseomicrobium palamuruense]
MNDYDVMKLEFSLPEELCKQTILHNNPSLTTRRPRGGRNPIRIVLDSVHTFPNTIVLQGVHN